MLKYKPLNIEVPIDDVKDFYTFSSEASLNELLLKNIDKLMQGVFSEEVKFATNKKAEIKGSAKLPNGGLLPLRGVRLDLWVECKSGKKYIIEIKNPKYRNYGSFNAVGQLLGYSIKFPEATNLVLLSTAYDEGLLELIQKYKLPIDFVLITEKSFYLLKK